MAEVIRIKRGLDIKLKGKSEEVFGKSEPATLFSVRPDDFQGIKPKVIVKDGDAVKAGSVLFYDKANPEMKFVSPVSGTILAVNRGDKRKFLDIRIQSDGKFESESFQKVNPSSMTSEKVKELLLSSGFWPFIKQRPYDIVANPNEKPKAIFISGFDTAPLAPDYDFVIQGKKEEFQLGVDALAKLTNGKIHIGVNVESASKIYKSLTGVEIHEFDGPHPTGNVGVQIHHIDPINKGESVWTINPQDVVTIGTAMKKGIYDFSKVIVLDGSSVKHPAYYRTVYGAQISNIVKGNVVETTPLRYISGNPLSGRHVSADGFLGAYDTQICVIPEGNTSEFLGWIMPRFKKFSVNHTYFSWLMGSNKEYALDTNLNGGERAFIMSNEYHKVFPMDILPEFLIKAILAKDIDKMEQLGIYEVAPEDFALCEFVCTSKIETQRIVREGLDYIRKELA
ncbi:MAG TPA: Na(+)-translocating NADH-quinone reductase subunit A [Paludibacteraceae bacterium]|nr:Na(+)-translocating NADH-quinone reductase subunit A [Paludibacteraceae bacterium]HQF50374.1 Na(+)-translocating NADH-quinone reductase subunit A [Paludibacteraceae bacterium]